VNTPELQPGETLTVEIPASPEGTYEMWCTVAGHKDAGMKGTVTVGMGGSHSMGSSSTSMSWSQMDAEMLKRAQAFPAKTQGHGGDRLEPKILADGTKEFDLVTKIVKWEVEPGKIVDAFTYNGVVPGPEIHVEVGDKVRVVVKNELPESTSVHWHGIRVPNNMDGVDPYTQMPIEPGQTFTYEFTALEPAVGIYHSHHDAQKQIPDGLFGAFTIGEMPVPPELIPMGYTEDKIVKTVNMVLNDSGAIGLSLNGKSFPATEPYTIKVGDIIKVNYYNEGLMGHPMHMHQPMGWVIAKDGIPLLTPTPADTIWVAPGERYTVLYKGVDPGVWAWHCHILTHAEGPNGMFGMVTALIVER
jgi:FtsP/CotA-like multicopper oxidase with cupredoxin domain